MTRRISRRGVLTATAGVALAPAWLRAAPATPIASPAAGWRFTDDRGVTVAAAERPTRVIAQTTSAAALWDFGYPVTGVYGPFRGANGKPDLQTGRIDLDRVTHVGDWGGFDVEKVFALGGDLYVDLDRGTGGLWYVDEDTAQLLDPLMPSVGIATVNRAVTDIIGRFGELAVALGVPADDPAVTTAQADNAAAVAKLQAAIAAKPGLRVLVISGAPGADLYIANPGVMNDLGAYRDLGLDVIVPEDILVNDGSVEWFGVTSWEQLGKYPADLILQDSREDVSALAGDPLWQSLPAVQAGQIGEWRGTFPYSWQGWTDTVTYMTGLIDQAKIVTGS